MTRVIKIIATTTIRIVLRVKRRWRKMTRHRCCLNENLCAFVVEKVLIGNQKRFLIVQFVISKPEADNDVQYVRAFFTRAAIAIEQNVCNVQWAIRKVISFIHLVAKVGGRQLLFQRSKYHEFTWRSTPEKVYRERYSFLSLTKMNINTYTHWIFSVLTSIIN